MSTVIPRVSTSRVLSRGMPDFALSLIPVTADDEPLLSAWLDGDADGMSHLSSYRDVQGWLGRLSERRWGWIAHSRGRPVGFLDPEADGASCSFSYYVAP